MGADSNRTSAFEDTLPGTGAALQDHGSQGQSVRARCWQKGSQRPAFWARAEEIDMRGMILCADRVPALGSEIFLSLHTDHGILQLAARVVHCLNGFGFGCRFVGLDERQSVALRFLRTMQAVPLAA